MALQAGSRLGPYEIANPLGAGGMGEVYRASDTRLGRDVAIKILPERYAADPEWRRRLEREARAVSSLSHPHVCSLFDVGHQDGIDFLVMEYLEGETLAARLQRGALPADHVLRYGSEIASALAAAHRRGVVHRDLKPGNVMITRAGARLLDFGLAKPALSVSLSDIDVTASAPLTAQGTLVGTYPYMSPEQVEGREIDARSDIFALGAVLYEMATGTRAFEGRTTASLIAAILEREPAPIASRQPLAPAALDDIVRGCLAKDPEDRWQTAHDVKLQLEGLRRRVATTGPDEGGARAGGAAVRRGSGSGATKTPRPRQSAKGLGRRTTGPVRASILPPRNHWFTPNDFQVSPDGTRLAFVAAGPDGRSTLWVSSMVSSQAHEIPGTEGATSPFWSSDSRRIGFFAQGRLKTVEPSGAGVQDLCGTLLTPGGGAWSRDDVIIFPPAVLGGLMQVPAGGGTPVPATTVPDELKGEAHRSPQFLPDGRRFLYVVTWTTQQRGGLYLTSLDGSAPRLVSAEVRSSIVLAGTNLLYADGGTLYARPFDSEQAQLTGEPRVVLRNEVAPQWRFEKLAISAASTGLLVFQSRLDYNSQLVLYDRSGKELGVVGEPGFWSPQLSPDGRYVAVGHDRDGTGQWSTTIFDRGRGISLTLPRVGTHKAHAWSPDGQWIYYSAIRERDGIYRRRADGSGAEETVLEESTAFVLVNSHSPAAPRLLYMDFANGTGALRELFIETKQTREVVWGAEGIYSPDGEWIAYVDFGLQSLAITHADRGGRIQVAGGGAQIRWRSDMTELYYIAPDKKLMCVPLTKRDGTIEPGNPFELFQTRIVEPTLVLFQYDVSQDGEEFLINSLPRADAAAPLSLIVNWEEIGV
jgi:eukaryotic-like serine/threonine-protein kinase